MNIEACRAKGRVQRSSGNITWRMSVDDSTSVASYAFQRQPAFSYALLVYMSIVVVLITIMPFNFRIPDRIQITWTMNFLDNITNIFLFIPVGFLFRLSRKKSNDPFCIKTLGFGILLSTAIEFTQAFIPGRHTQVIDVMINGSGAWLGASICRMLESYIKKENAVSLSALELPLMNLVYLLIPLLWLNGLATGKEVQRLWSMLLLGLFGGCVLSSIYTYRLKNAGTLSLNMLFFVIMGWFIIASIPVLLNLPGHIIFLGGIIGIVARIQIRFQKKANKDERRFELSTLKKLLPLYIVYLLLFAVWPTTLPLNESKFSINFQELMLNERIVFTFRFIEFIAAFTLLGYMIAEMRGRKKESVGKTFSWVFFITLMCSITIEILRGYPPLILEIVIVTAASIYGGIIYRLQLSAIRRM